MDIQKRGLITLIKSAFKCEKYELPPSFDVVEALRTAEKQNIVTMVYSGIHNCGFDVKSDKIKNAFSSVCKSILVNETQNYNLSVIENAFEKNGIDYMLLKGARLKKSYPKSEMRSMGDIDILIKLEQYAKIKQIMNELGYFEKQESDHELIWEKENLVVELHKRVIPSYNKDYFAYFEDGWKFAVATEEGKKHSYLMNKNDEFIYLFIHFCKHFRDSGVGIKHLIDLWHYRQINADLDEIYILEKLKELKVDEFYQNVLRTIDCLFNEKDSDEKVELITDVIFCEGKFNASQARVLSASLKKFKQGENVKKQKIKRCFNSIFVPFKVMCGQYRFLKKAPFLLPFMWVFHLFKRLFTKGRLKKYNREIAEINKENVSKYQRYLNCVGLDYNFDEQKD